MCPFCYEGNKVGARGLTIICQAVYLIVNKSVIVSVGVFQSPQHTLRFRILTRPYTFVANESQHLMKLITLLAGIAN